jgi:hypothetical protein
MIDATPVADEADERRSLDAYCEAWPNDSFGYRPAIGWIFLRGPLA